MVRVFCKEKSMQNVWLWTELGCNFDVRASVRSSHRVKGVIVAITGGGEVSGPWVVSRVIFRCSIRSTGEVGLQLDFGSISDVRASPRLSFR